ncbi:MAG: hypothetical protein CVT94_13270 [Bacteroidetes bacterium HGW-Bacteroidetes-11]|nr:MAG: hypothetical protein CVT94_13270 [Bacteroidetes bacterium HGW-Bacteroidetes-11]
MDLSPESNKKIIHYSDILALTAFLIIGIGFFFLFLHLHHSNEVLEYLNRVNLANSTAGLWLTVIYGIVKLLSVILGLSLPGAVIYKFLQFINTNR